MLFARVMFPSFKLPFCYGSLLQVDYLILFVGKHFILVLITLKGLHEFESLVQERDTYFCLNQTLPNDFYDFTTSFKITLLWHSFF